MSFSLLVGLTLVAWASGAPGPVEPNLARGYHELVGIPAATRIKEFEDRILAQNLNQTARIVGGAEAAVNEFPHLCGLVISFLDIAGVSACGSSLVSANRLVTAAHCWFDGNNQASQFLVVLGSMYLFSGGTRVATSQVIMHPQWTPSTLANDVAVILLPTSIFFTNSIQPVAMPNNLQLAATFEGEWGTAAGYGRTSDQQVGISLSAVVSHVNMQVISVAQCQATFGTWAQASNICTNGAGGVGICNGDSGGPLTVVRDGQTVLVGISSFVAAAGCQLGFPSAFARITSFYSFIIQNMV